MGRKKIYVNESVLVKTYKKTMSLIETSKKLNISYNVARSRLIEFGIKLKNRGGQLSSTCNNNFFYYDTPESFYWAGFIAADGCVYKSKNNGYTISIFLKKEDESHIEKFKNSINSSNTILFRKSLAGITIHSKKMFNDLSRFNIIPRKSLIYSIPQNIVSHPLINHFLRGYSDGDGCWSISSSSKTLRFHLCGTNDFLEKIKEIFYKNCSTSLNKKIGKIKNIYQISYEGNLQSKRIRDFLYCDSGNMYLSRKKDIAYNNWIDIMIHSGKIPVVGYNSYTGETIYLNSMADGKKFGFNHSGISECCSGKRKLHKGYTWKRREGKI